MVAEPEKPAERREVRFSGRVQGVDFRYTARQIAARFPVTGFVQNLPDDRVLLVAEGQPAAIDRFLDDLQAELGRHIDAAQVRKRPATGEFDSFEIEH